MDYNVLYATLVGRVDTVLAFLDRMIEDKNFDWVHILQVRRMLQDALMEAEERYIEAEERRADSLIVLPHKDPP